MKINRVTVAAVGIVAAFFAISAFQNQTLKFGVVDLGAVADGSKLGARKRVEFDARRDKMTALMQFVAEQRVVSRAQCSQLKTLMLTANPTPAQAQELKQLQDQVRAQKTEFDTLMRVVSPRPDQLQRANELSAMANEAQEILRDWNQEFNFEMQQLRQAFQEEVLEKAKEAAKKVSQRGGFSTVFEAGVAVYAANDITQDAIKQMDTDNP
jgi:Skp family chaperone for outer membrane proteins